MRVKKIISISFGSLLAVIILLYAVLWVASNKHYPVEYGISFSRQYAESLGLDWQKVYLAMLDELKPKYIRLAVNWDEVESEKGKFNYQNTDWQMNEANQRGVKVLLVVGQKTPRWPECNPPTWAKSITASDYAEEFFIYLNNTVERYHNNSALEMWQVENEPFINFKFGECANFQENLVEEEIAQVKKIDSQHKVLLTDSGELGIWRKAIKAGDLFGTTLYRIVRTPSGKIWSYDWLPPVFYQWKAKAWGLTMKNFVIAELQAEPWFSGGNANNTSLSEQEKTMNPERLQKHFDYAERLGASRAYLWGVEWWYWMKEGQKDERYWEIVKARLSS